MASSFTPAITIHVAMACSALLLGPVALSLKKGTRGHRAAGYAWVTVMLGAALSALFIRDHGMTNIAGYTPIHLLVLATFLGLGRAFYAIAQRRIAVHKKAMWSTYLGACVTAGLFALLPGRLLGQLVWGQWLGWL